MTDPTNIDIRQSADRVIALLQQNRAQEAMRLLEQERRDERPVVQEALDRYVAAGAADRIAALGRPGAVAVQDEATRASLGRLATVTQAPRFPVVQTVGDNPVNELQGLTAAQQYDVYASIVATRGNQNARDALAGQNRVILGLRQENSTLAAADRSNVTQAAADNPQTRRVDESRAGTGIYNDRVVVLWRGTDGSRHLEAFNRANTEPTAQYDHHAGSDGHRRFSEGGVDTQVRAASPGYQHVGTRRKIEGVDVNGDGLHDLARLAEGTIEMQAATHPRPRSELTDFALRPSPDALTPAARAGRVQRDTNGDGWFNQADINGAQDLDRSFKVHPGSNANTDSAGCQTIQREDYRRFETAVRGNAQQTRWQYVLTSTSPGAARGLGAAVEHAPGEQQQPQPAPQRHQPPANDHRPVPQPRAGNAHGERFPPGRADAALFEAIHRQLPAGTSEAQAAHVMAQAKQSGIGEAHQLDKVAVVDGNAWVVGRTPGFLAKVDLSAPVPPLAESLRQSEQLDQQQTAQGLERQQSTGARGLA